ncbi:MAG TPA: hypothetical protein VLE19_15150 [Pyrinomonadaceae bacterium]|nr:hypothetical protein [Pyrinomonadaceae bacterium]
MPIRISGARTPLRRGWFLVCAVVAFFTLIGPAAIRPDVVSAASDCRVTDSLRMFPDVLSNVRAIRVGSQPWRVIWSLNAASVQMLCDQDFYCPGNRDHLVFRPSLSTNIDSADPVPDTFPFPDCKLVWDIDPVSDSGDIVIAFRTKYQVNGSLRRKSAQVTIHQAGYVSGTEMDISNTVVELQDDGLDG